MTSLQRFVRAATLAACAVMVSAQVLPSQAAQTGATTTVIVVRHAEKAAEPAGDPPLSAAGEARARALFEAIRDSRVSAVVTTQYIRTKATAQPTVSALSLPTEVVTAGPVAMHARAVAAAVRKHPGQTVLVVGHSNTVPDIVEALGAKRPPPICDAEYDNLYIVTIAPDGTAGVIHSRFGARTPVGADCAAMR